MSERLNPTILTPGERLRAEIQRLGLDQGKLAQLTNVSRQTINNIVNGRYLISRGMAARLALLTGQDVQYWLQNEFAESALERAQSPARPHATARPAFAPAREFAEIDAETQADLRQVLFDLLRRYAQSTLELGERRYSASIDKIGLKFVAETDALARNSAASAALTGLREFGRAKPELMESEQVWAYRSLVADIGAKLTLDAFLARKVAALLGLSFIGDGNIVQLRNGRLRILPLPEGSAEVELRILSEQLGEPLAEIIAAIAG